MSIQNDPDTISIDHDGNFTFLASWRYPRDGQFSDLWNIAINARAEAANFFDHLANVASDARLSDAAKAEDSKKIAQKALTNFGNFQRHLNQIATRLDADRLKLAEIALAAPSDAIVDVALAQHFRTLAERDREAAISAMVEGSEQRMVDALLRLPNVLFGVSDKIRSVIEANAIVRRSPDEARAIQQQGEALRTAQAVVSKTAGMVTQRVGLTLEERMVSLGDGGWQAHVRDGAPDALAALARKYNVE